MDKPKGYESDLGAYEPMYGENGIDYAWGFIIARHLGEERFNALKEYGSVEVVDHSSWPVRWAVITKTLSQNEYIEQIVKKYGEVTKIKVGPKGGFRYIVYGRARQKYSDEPGTVFYGSMACPDFDKHDPIVEWEPPTPAMLALVKRNKLKKAAKERAKAKKLAKKQGELL